MTKPQTAKIFMTGGSQAVRLPAEFRFEGKEVRIRRDPATGDVILSRVESWEEYFEWAAKQDWPEDFLADREQPIDDFLSPFDKDPIPVDKMKQVKTRRNTRA